MMFKVLDLDNSGSVTFKGANVVQGGIHVFLILSPVCAEFLVGLSKIVLDVDDASLQDTAQDAKTPQDALGKISS